MILEYLSSKISEQQVWTYVVIQRHDILYNLSQSLPYSAVFQARIPFSYIDPVSNSICTAECWATSKKSACSGTLLLYTSSGRLEQRKTRFKIFTITAYMSLR